MTLQLPDPRLTLVYRLEIEIAPPLDLGEVDAGHRRIVAQTGGTFTGPGEINGKLLPGSSADWQIVLPDGTARGDIRCTLETDGGDLLYVQSRSVRSRRRRCPRASRARRRGRLRANTRSAHRRDRDRCAGPSPG